MKEKYQDKYRIQSNRLKGWDYSDVGYYYITICTKDRTNYFGKITNGLMQLSEIGIILKSEWLRTPIIRKDMNVGLDEFIIMPNHIHGIIIINGDGMESKRDVCNTSLQPASNSISSIVRGVKASVTSKARKINPKFGWQANYYDHIIRNEKSLYEIRKYIIDNPLKWELDKYNNSNYNHENT